MCRVRTVEFPAEASAVPEARRWLRRQLEQWDLGELSGDACLLLTELVTNGVLHAASPVSVVAAVAEGLLEVGVGDHDTRPVGTSPHRRRSAFPRRARLNGSAAYASRAGAWCWWTRSPTNGAWQHWSTGSKSGSGCRWITAGRT